MRNLNDKTNTHGETIHSTEQFNDNNDIDDNDDNIIIEHKDVK